MTTLSIPFPAYDVSGPMCIIGLQNVLPPPAANISSLSNYLQHVTPSSIDTISLPKVGVPGDDRQIAVTLSCSMGVDLSNMAWLEPTMRALAQFLWFPEDWDSYGSRRVASRAIEKMIETLLSILNVDAPLPAVVPTSQGGIQVEWHQNQIDLEIEANGSGALGFFYKDSKEELEGTVEDISVLSDLARRLRAS